MSETHGPAVDVVPSDAAKQYRRAAASAMVSAGMLVTALQTALPYLHEAKWLPIWAAPLVAAFGAGWQSWKQARDAGNIAPVNLTMPAVAIVTDAQPAVRDLRQEIPSVAHEAFHPSPMVPAVFTKPPHPEERVPQFQSSPEYDNEIISALPATPHDLMVPAAEPRGSVLTDPLPDDAGDIPKDE